jgi:import inner membrane translocase subunit TIM50
VSCFRLFASDSAAGSSVSSTGLADEVLKTKIVNEANKAAAEPPSDEEQKKRENSARALKFTLIAFGGIVVGAALYVFFVWGAPLKDRRGREIRDEFSDLPFFEQYAKRAMHEVHDTITLVTDPSREKLLPDPVQPPYHQPPYTLLVELTDVLVHPDWTYETGWRFKKRPGVDYFLNQLGGFTFEVVIYTKELGFTAFPIIDALDSQNVVAYRLFRDSTKYQNGHHVKDLDRINRDLSKVIVIDCNPAAVQEHRNNAIVLPKWKGNDDDRTLYDLVALLKTISSNDIKDVRLVLEHYAKFEDPIEEFRKKQQLLALQEKEREAHAKDTKPPGIGVSPGWLMNVFRKG